MLFVILGVKILAYTKDTESEIDIYLGFKYLSENKRHFNEHESKHNRKNSTDINELETNILLQNPLKYLHINECVNEYESS